MKILFSLGDLYVSDFIKMDEVPQHKKESLTLVLDENIGAARLSLLLILMQCMVSIGIDPALIQQWLMN